MTAEQDQKIAKRFPNWSYYDTSSKGWEVFDVAQQISNVEFNAIMKILKARRFTIESVPPRERPAYQRSQEDQHVDSRYILRVCFHV